MKIRKLVFLTHPYIQISDPKISEYDIIIHLNSQIKPV